jgi:hypothetical protein
MQLVYDSNDLEYANRRGDLRLDWLRDLGAIPIDELTGDGDGFFFGYQVPMPDYAATVKRFPALRDRPDDRRQLATLDGILQTLDDANIKVPTPRTWILRVDDALPDDLTFPLFVRTSTSSWKRGGRISKVRTVKELQDECELLRRAFRWDATILAREWLNLRAAGTWRYGSVPVEARVWIIDGVPYAWSFHYLHAVPDPKGFPPSADDLIAIAQCAQQFAAPFTSRLIAADFAQDRKGNWYFLEAGPGACSGTGHREVFMAVASRLCGKPAGIVNDAVGGLLRDAVDSG